MVAATIFTKEVSYKEISMKYLQYLKQNKYIEIADPVEKYHVHTIATIEKVVSWIV